MRPAPARYPIIPRPPLRLVVAVLLAVACALVVLRATDRAEATVARYGAEARAWVAQRALAPGDVVEAGDVSLEARPAAFVPDGAVSEDPVGRRVTGAVASGEVVLDGRLDGGDRRGAAALVPEGWRAVAVPVLEAPLPVEVGQRVDVLAAGDGSEGAVGSVVAEDGVVVHVAEDGTTTVAVTRTAAARVVAALAGGYVALALVA